MESVRESVDTVVIEVAPEVSTQEKPRRKESVMCSHEYEMNF